MKISFDYDIPKYNTRFRLINNMETGYIQFINSDIKSYRCQAYHRLVKPKVICVDCLENECVLCKSEDKSIAKLKYVCYIPIYNYVKDKIQIWERPLRWSQETLSRLLSIYGKDQFVNTVFRVTRVGKPGDLETSYVFNKSKTNEPKNLNMEYEKSQFNFSINIQNWSKEEQRNYLIDFKAPDKINYEELIL